MNKGYRRDVGIGATSYYRVYKNLFRSQLSMAGMFSMRLFQCKWQTSSKAEIDLIKFKHFSFLFYGCTHK